MSCPGANYIVPGADPCAGGGGGGGVQSVAGGAGISITGDPTTIPIVNSQPIICQFLKTSNQTQLSVGPTSIFWNNVVQWKDANSENYIWFNGISATTFRANTRGVYTLELDIRVLNNGATWTTPREIQIVIQRAADPSVFTRLRETLFPPSGNDYNATVFGTIALQDGDLVNCQLFGDNTTGNALIQGLSGVLDFNTTFTWTFIRPYP
jgi:hypothetical protein